MRANKSDPTVTEEIRGGRGEPPLSSSPVRASISAFWIQARHALGEDKSRVGHRPVIGIPPGISGNREALLQHVPHTSLGFFAYVLA